MTPVLEQLRRRHRVGRGEHLFSHPTSPAWRRSGSTSSPRCSSSSSTSSRAAGVVRWPSRTSTFTTRCRSTSGTCPPSARGASGKDLRRLRRRGEELPEGPLPGVSGGGQPGAAVLLPQAAAPITEDSSARRVGGDALPRLRAFSGKGKHLLRLRPGRCGQALRVLPG